MSFGFAQAKKEELKHDIIALANCVVMDENDNHIRLSALWQRKAAIFVFLRHFSCIACRAHVKEVWANREDYQRNGGRIHFIGNGSIEAMRNFRTELGLEKAIILTDPSLVSFRAAGFRRGFMKTVGPGAIVNAMKLYDEGHRQKKLEEGSGDLWQLGGVLVVQTDGRLTYQFISQDLGDFPAVADISIIAGASRQLKPNERFVK